MNSTVLPCRYFDMKHQCVVATMPTIRTVWLLLNIILDGELCLCDGKNAACLQVHHLSPLQASMENVTLCVRISRNMFLSG